MRGGHNRLTDAEKIARGTFRPSRGEAVYKADLGAKVIAGPWLDAIPEPQLPLGPEARMKYDELARMLFDQNKLTVVTRSIAEGAAVLFGQIHRRESEGRDVPASMAARYLGALQNLKIAEEAPEIATPGNKRNAFDFCGFANRPRPPARL